MRRKRTRLCCWLACLVLALSLTGCAASLILQGAALRGVASAAGRGAMTAAARAVATRGGASGLGRIAAGTSRGTVGRAAGLATARTPLMRSLLRDLTRAGRSRATLSIDRIGRVRLGGRHVATIESSGDIAIGGGLQGSRVVVGRLQNGLVWEVDGAGAVSTPVGRVVARFPGRSVSVMDGTTASARTAQILRNDVTVEVLQIRNDWYHVRLVDGRSGWIYAPFALIGIVLMADAEEEESADSRSDLTANMLLSNGQLIWAGNVADGDGYVEGVMEDGSPVILDESIVRWLEVAEEQILIDWQAPRTVRLTNGSELIVASCTSRGSLFQAKLIAEWSWQAETIVLDRSIVVSGCR